MKYLVGLHDLKFGLIYSQIYEEWAEHNEIKTISLEYMIMN